MPRASLVVRKLASAGYLCATIGCLAVAGAAPSQEDPSKLHPDVERVDEDRYRIGKVSVDLKARTATCAGKVNMRRGVIEYLAVTPNGKRHESVLALDVRPLHLQLGLILLGLEPKGGLTVQGDERPPKGSPVELWVSWPAAGKTVRVRGEDLAWDMDRKRPMGPKAWIFSGSIVKDGRFAADEEGSIVGTFRDPAAIINNSLPAGADDATYKVNERIAPPVGTPVTFTITPAS